MTGPSDKRPQDGNAAPPAANAAGGPALPARRALLRGAAAAVPTILTLNSGAALARSSNVISLTHESPPKGNSYLCLEKGSVRRIGHNRYDLGEPPQADVTAIPQRKYYRTKDTDYGISPDEMCEHGGEFYYRVGGSPHANDVPGTDSGWRRVSLRRGGLVSATAIGSFAKYPGVRINSLKDI